MSSLLDDRPMQRGERIPVTARLLSVEATVVALLVWHVLLAVGALGMAVVTAAGGGPEGPLGAAIAVVAVLVALASVLAAWWVRTGEHRGRVLSLVLTYLVLVGAAFQLLQVVGVFTGLDAVGANMARALPGLGIVVLGFLLGNEGLPESVRRYRRIVFLAGVAVTLVLLGLLPGLVEFVRRLADPAALTLLAVVVVAAVLVHRTWQMDVARRFDATKSQLELLDGLLFLSPNVIGFLAFFAGPLLFSLVISLFDWDPLGDRSFIGLDNYLRILALDVSFDGSFSEGYRQAVSLGPLDIGARDPLFWKSVGNVMRFTLLAVPAAVVPGLFLAIALNSDTPGIKVFRAIFFVPSVAGVVAVALIWKQLFNATSGYVNYVTATVVGWLDAVPGISASDPAIQWLSDADVALYSLVIVFAWQYVGFNTVLFLAGLQGIQTELYEAAALDGAGWWQRFRHITLPQLAPTTFFVVSTTVILTLQLFGEAVVLFPSNQPIGSGPANATITPVVYLYDQGFRRFSQGYASSVAWVLFALIFLFTYVQFRRQRGEAGI